MTAAKHRGWYFLLVTAFIATATDAAQVVTRPFLGIELIHQTETSPRPLNIYAAKIDLSAPGISFMVTPRSSSYPGPIINGAPAETMRQTTRNFVNQVGAQLGINTNFYATEVPATGWANNVGLVASNGDKYSPWDPFAGPPDFKQWYENYFHDALNITQSNVAQFLKMPDTLGDGFQTLPSATLYNTVTGQYRLLQNGNVRIDLPATALNPITAIGTTADNKLIMLAIDGRRPGFSEGMTVIEAANLLKNSYGATNAILLDGGGSTTMVVDFYNDGVGGQVLNVPSDNSERAVGSNLAVFALPNGDYNQNGTLDAGDYVVWRKTISHPIAYDAWKTGFGNSANGLQVGGSIPEPSACSSVFVVLFCLLNCRAVRVSTTI